ncbi:hypothetical protein STEG23_033010 [Scotinomys teguina]
MSYDMLAKCIVKNPWTSIIIIIIIIKSYLGLQIFIQCDGCVLPVSGLVSFCFQIECLLVLEAGILCGNFHIKCNKAAIAIK